MAIGKASDPNLERAMHDSMKAYEEGSPKFFEFLRDDVRVYSLNSPIPTTSRREFEEAFKPNYEMKRAITVMARDLQESPQTAVLSQTLEITAGGLRSNVRQTVIWNQESGEWKMSHIHNALVGQPLVVDVQPRTIESIRVLNERIATVASTVGVAQ